MSMQNRCEIAMKQRLLKNMTANSNIDFLANRLLIHFG